MKTLIIFGNPSDPHIKRVGQELADLGVTAAIYSSVSDLRLAPDPVTWSLDAQKTEQRFVLSLPIINDKITADIDAKNAVWWMRNKFRVYSITNDTDQRNYFELGTREAFARSVITATGATSINGDPSSEASNRKLVQLKTAHDLGFPIPATVITSSQEEIVSFLRKYPRCVAKPLQLSYVPPINKETGIENTSDVSILTNRIHLDEVQGAHRDEFLSAPLIIQEEIAKQYELRIVAFRDDLIAYRILSQNFDDATVDWRRCEQESDIVDKHEFTIDQNTREFVRRFLAASHLDTGVFDFAVDDRGRIVFFECNPAGQWGLLEPGNGDPVAKMFARNIMKLCIEST